MFTALLAFTALLVAGCGAYFSVLGIATLFSGHFWQVAIMAGSLELGKLVATSFLYRYWKKIVWFLKLYMIVAVLVLMVITSMGIFGYLSSGYQVNAGKTELIDNKVALIEQQKTNIKNEIDQINARITTLNEARKSQEARLPQMSRRSAAPVYEDMARAAEEIKGLTARAQVLQTTVFEKDNELISLSSEGNEVHDIGTFKFVSESVGLPLDTVVKIFIICIVLVFDPLAVSLVLAYNIAKGGSILKETTPKQLLVDQPVPVKPKTKTTITEEIIEEIVPDTENKTRKYSGHLKT
jgi:Tfp pilus assembly protein PilO